MALYDETLIRSFERACGKYPDHTALIYIGEKFSYKRLKELIVRLVSYKVPSYIEFRDMLPKSKVGKLLRREIREEERRRIAKGERTIRV